MPKQTFFSDKWLEDAEFKDWIKKVDNNIHFGCKRCKKNDLSLGNMGSEALQKHAKGKKHCKAREEWIEVKKGSPKSPQINPWRTKFARNTKNSPYKYITHSAKSSVNIKTVNNKFLHRLLDYI